MAVSTGTPVTTQTPSQVTIAQTINVVTSVTTTASSNPATPPSRSYLQYLEIIYTRIYAKIHIVTDLFLIHSNQVWLDADLERTLLFLYTIVLAESSFIRILYLKHHLKHNQSSFTRR